MNEPHDRPDPDALLRRMQAAEARSKRGELKVFFGFAPGVGKTYRMLQVARDLAMSQKLDVVVGVVEDHGRSETAAMVDGLEVLARKRIEYRGRTLEEFDLDAALARKPKVLLVDELAHTNAPGSRHPKRWQDVEELLAAGIDVFSTINVQHLESLNDVIAQITHVQVRETVPDRVLDRAETIEVVDIAPEELLERLKEGKVYLPEHAKRARRHFFQRGNLLALRELALRRTAEHVDEDVREYREEHGVLSAWPAGERILVCIGPAPSSGRLIRAAARMGAGLRCPWVAAYVETAMVGPMSEADRQRLDAHLRLAESLGAAVIRLSGQSVAEALLGYARKHNVTRIIIGKPSHSRLRDRVRGSLLDEVVRGSGDIDVHVIRGDSPSETPRPKAHSPRRGTPPRNYAYTLMLVAVVVAMANLLNSVLGLPDLEMLFVLAVMISAVWFGRGPSMLAASLGVACYDFFFVPPLHTFSVEDRRYFLTFVTMFLVSFAISELTERLRRQGMNALSREERANVLYSLTRELAMMAKPARIAAIAARQAADVFAARVVVLDASPEGGMRTIGAAPADTIVDEKDLGVARWSFEHDQVAGFGTDTLPGARVTCMPLRAGVARLGVLALVTRERVPLHLDQFAFLDVFCRQVAGALERARLAEEARLAALRAKTEEMRSSLLSAVSQDLRTPLATITGAAATLRDGENLDEETADELIEAIVDQAARLERLVANLLDMTRLESGSVDLKRAWVPLEELVGSALTRLEDRLGARPITVCVAPKVPLLYVDPALFEQVFVNLLENADKYTPAGTPIEILANTGDHHVHIDVRDFGPGLVAGSEFKVFEKFFRDAHHGVPGAGLGLAICKGIVEAHGGSISAENLSDGAVFHILIPRGDPPPAVLPGKSTP